MARVTGDFNSDVIRTYKGVLDFYYWRGIGVVRGWPRKPLLPRSPAVQAAGQDWRDNSRAISALPLTLQIATAEEVRDTAYTWKDAWTTTVYGHGLTWTLRQGAGDAINENEKTMKVNLVASPTDASAVFNVNSTNFMSAWSKTFVVPFSILPFTHYKVLCSASSTQAGQTVQLAVGTDLAVPVPVHTPAPDLTFTNAFTRQDSGWRSIDNIPTTDQLWNMAFKGSNGTVDINLQMLEITFAIL